MHLTEVQQLAKQRPVDIAFIAVKSYDTDLGDAADPPVSRAGRLCGVVAELHQRGTHRRRRRLGPHASAASSAARWRRTVRAGTYSPQHAEERATHVSFHVGELHGRITRRVEELAEMLDDVDTAQATDNLWGERWSKLCVNGMRNGVSAATGMGGNARDSA